MPVKGWIIMALEKKTLIVDGMSCEHCVHAVKTAVGGFGGVKNVEVDLKTKRVDVDFDSDFVTLDQIRNAIEDQGYDVE